MNERKTVNPTIDSKKLWTAPALQIIQLNAARNSTGGTKDDGVSVRSLS